MTRPQPTAAKEQRDGPNYGSGSMKERAPGVWRLRFMRNGRQVEETFPGHENGRDQAPPQRPDRLRMLDAIAVEKTAESPETTRSFASTISHRWRVVRKACEGAARVRFHDLRHTNISELIAAGVDVRTVAGRVGHSSARMTLDMYAHVIPAADQAATAVVGDLLKS